MSKNNKTPEREDRQVNSNDSPMSGGRFGTGAKAKNFKKSMGNLAKYLKPVRILIMLGLIFAVAGTILSILGPKLSTEIAKPLAAYQYTKYIDMENLISMALTVIVVYVCSAIFTFIDSIIFAKVTAKVSKDLRTDISKKINRLPLKYFDRNTYGDLLSRITNDVDTISQTLNNSLSPMVTSIAMIIGLPIMMFTINWQLTLIAIASIPIMFILLMLVVVFSQKYFKRQQKNLGQINGHVEEIYSSHNVVKVFNGEEKALETFDNFNNKLYTNGYKSQFISGLMMPIMNFVGNLAYAFICIIAGIQMINNGSMDFIFSMLASLPFFLIYLKQLNQPMQQMATVTTTLQQTAAAAERVFEFLEEEEQKDESKCKVVSQKEYVKLMQQKEKKLAPILKLKSDLELKQQQSIKKNENFELLLAEYNNILSQIEKINAEYKNYKMTLDKVKGNVEFKNVAFGYTAEKEIIHNFSCNAKAGQKVAIVGPTGAGKTTLVNLLMRFYEINKGDILIDGFSINDMERSYVRSLFGMVLQDTWLFEGSIKENIAFGRPKATDEEVIKACETSNIDHLIKSLPNGYDMLLEEDSSLSAGEKQLFTIARAMVQNSPMLILDEATSSVDTRTEELIQKAMDKLMKGRTSFVIAHRLSTIKNADLILVMKDGDVIETGNHKQLIDKNGFYADLYNSQFSAKHKEIIEEEILINSADMANVKTI